MEKAIFMAIALFFHFLIYKAIRLHYIILLNLREKRNFQSRIIFLILTVLFLIYVCSPIIPVWLNSKLNAFEKSKENLRVIISVSHVLFIVGLFSGINQANKYKSKYVSYKLSGYK